MQREESEARGLCIADEMSSEESQRDSVSEQTNSNNSISLATTASESINPALPLPSQPLEQLDSNRSSKSTALETNTNSSHRLKSVENVQEIPKLPKPISGRSERAKLSNVKTTEVAKTSVVEVSSNNKSEDTIPPFSTEKVSIPTFSQQIKNKSVSLNEKHSNYPFPKEEKVESKFGVFPNKLRHLSAPKEGLKVTRSLEEDVTGLCK